MRTTGKRKLVETLTENVNSGSQRHEAKVTVDEIVLSDRNQADETLEKVRTEGTDFATVAKRCLRTRRSRKDIQRHEVRRI